MSNVPGSLALCAALCCLGSTAPARADGFANDKAAHLTVGAGIAAASYAGASALTPSRPLRLVLGLSASLAASAGKELLDATGYGQPDALDFAWGTVGAASGVLFALGIDLLRGDGADCAIAAQERVLLRF